MIVNPSPKNKLLAVDDNSENLEIILAVLGDDYDLRAATDGNAALDLILNGFLPDLILLDVMMPGIDGYEVCRRLKADRDTKDIPIIFISGLINEEDESKGLALGAVDYITKPLSPNILNRRVQTHLELKKNRDHLRMLVAEKNRDLLMAKSDAERGTAYLDGILKSAPVGIGLVVDRELKFVNKKMEQMVGYANVDLEGKSSRILYASDDEFKRVGIEKYSQFREHGTGSVDTQLVTKSGSIIDVFLSSTPLDRDNLSSGVIFSALDITERKRQEKILSAKLQLKKLSETHSLLGLIQESIDIVEKATDSSFGFFCFSDPDEKNLPSHTWSSNTSERICAAFTSGDHSPELEPGVWGHEGGTVIHNKRPDQKSWSGGHDGSINREMLVPIKRAGKVVAIFGFGNKSTDYVGSDVDIAEKLADISWDIIQRKQAEETIRSSEEKFSRIFKLSPEPISLSRFSDGVFLDINPGFSSLFGWNAGEVLGRSSYDLNLWCGADDRENYISILVEKKEITNIEACFRHKDGHFIDVIVSARMLDIDNETCLMTIIRDMTEIRKIEKSVIKAKEEWESTFDAMSDMVTILDSNMRIVRANKSAYEFWGENVGDLEGVKCCDAFGGSAVNCSGCPLLAAMENNREFSEIISHKNDNKIFQVTSLPIPRKGEPSEHFIHIVRDITEQKQLEKEADSANRLASLGVLAAGVAHEINNPNALILYNSEILNTVLNDFLPSLAEHAPPDPQQLYGGLTYQELTQEVPVLLPGIHDSAQRIKRIVNDLRDFSRQDSSETDETIELNQIVQTSVRLTHNAIKKATDSFTMELGVDLPAIHGNSGRLVQVLINLLLNATQALENSSQVVSISTAYDMKIDRVKVVVSDTGKGMANEVLEHIFEPFITTKRDEGGTGLGLSISNRIVREHGGSLTFNSALGKGTSAVLSLPVCKEGNHVN